MVLVVLGIVRCVCVFFVVVSFSQCSFRGCEESAQGGVRFAFCKTVGVVSCVASAFWWRAYVTGGSVQVGSCLSCSGELS